MSNAGSEITAAVRRLVIAAGGQMVNRPVFRDQPHAGGMREEPGPLAAVRAAAALEHEAAQAVASYTRRAREDGRTWDEIGESLIPGLRPGGTLPKAVAAFDRLAWSSGPWQAASFNWTCPACRQVIGDHGPEGGGHPAEVEEGHTDDCARLAAAVTEWNRRWGDEL
jgi:hypothetical protein